MKPLKDELTTKMHSDLKVDVETDQTHVIWSVLQSWSDWDDTDELSVLCETYGVTMESVLSEIPNYMKIINEK